MGGRYIYVLKNYLRIMISNTYYGKPSFNTDIPIKVSMADGENLLPKTIKLT